MSFLNSLNWRIAEKHFDPEKKINQNNLSQILDSVQLAPTSFGLQPFHIYVVESQEVKEKLQQAGYNQPQFTESSHTLIFAARNDVEKRIDQYIEIASNQPDSNSEGLQAYASIMHSNLGGLTPEQKTTWAAKQAYIALGFALAACAELHIDSCPMEGFSAEQFNQILNLPENQTSVVALAIGYRKELPHKSKVRFSKDDLFTHI